jgi:hypothetical protein
MRVQAHLTLASFRSCACIAPVHAPISPSDGPLAGLVTLYWTGLVDIPIDLSSGLLRHNSTRDTPSGDQSGVMA